MLKCWDVLPNNRPSFSTISQLLLLAANDNNGCLEQPSASITISLCKDQLPPILPSTKYLLYPVREINSKELSLVFQKPNDVLSYVTYRPVFGLKINDINTVCTITIFDLVCKVN